MYTDFVSKSHELNPKSPAFQSRLAWFTKTLIEPKLPGASRVVPLLDPLFNKLSNLNPFYVRDAAKLWAQLQRICKRPYVPAFDPRWALSYSENRDLVDNVSRYFLFAALLYPPTHVGPFKVAQGLRASEPMDTMLKTTFPSVKIIYTQKETTGPVPAHLVAVDHQRQEIIVAIRGSAEAADWVINLVCRYSPLGTHLGMHEAARALQEKLDPTLDEWVTHCPRYNIILTGHSMGAGVASLVAMDYKLHNKYEGKVKAIVFATPVLLKAELLDTCKADITNFIFARDIVSHGGFKAIHIYTQLLSEMAIMLTSSKPTLICRLRVDSDMFRLVDSESSNSSNGDEDETRTEDGVTTLSPFLKKSESNPCLLNPSTLSTPEYPSGPVDVSLHFPVPLHDLCSMADHKIAELDHREAQGAELPTSLFSSLMSFSFLGWTKPAVPVDIFEECLETIEEQWRFLSDMMGSCPCLPGKIIHVIPREHLNMYDCDYHGNNFIHDCVFVEVPKERTRKWCADCYLGMEAIFDHLIEYYATAFAKDHLISGEALTSAPSIPYYSL